MLRHAALAVALAHLAAGVVGALVIAPGTPAGEPEPVLRMTYIAAHSEAWLFAWFVPMIAALTMIWLAVALKARLQEHENHEALDLAVALVLFGAAVEVSASCLGSVMLPGLARTQELATFQSLELTVLVATSTVGNTGFTAGQLLFVRALKHAAAPGSIVNLGYANVVAGGAFMAVGVANVPGLVPVATGAVFLTLAIFCIVLSRSEFARMPTGQAIS